MPNKKHKTIERNALNSFTFSPAILSRETGKSWKSFGEATKIAGTGHPISIFKVNAITWVALTQSGVKDHDIGNETL